MLSKIHSAQIIGLKPQIIDIEVDVSKGLNSFSIVGLGDKAIEESKDRIISAIKNSGFETPKMGSKKIVVSLAPADIKKEGPSFDLPIALGYMVATEIMNFDSSGKIFIGELSLSGKIRGIKGSLIITEKAKKEGFSEIYLPAENAEEAALVRGIKIFPCKCLKDIFRHLDKKTRGPKIEIQPETKIEKRDSKKYSLDMADVKGQETAKRGLEIAAAGGHNIALFGPPGTGKTMLAKSFSGILPELNEKEIIEVTGIHSATGDLDGGFITEPPFRSPHHTSSYISLVGGGAWPKPGEITLAHRGVLFLDEFPEFEKRVIETLRQPLEDRIVSISRARGSIKFPAGFILIAAMNMCPCGNKGLKEKECICSVSDLNRYARKISGPIMDRIDIWVNVPQIDHRKLADTREGESSESIRERVKKARKMQKERFIYNERKIMLNSEMGIREIKKYTKLSKECEEILINSAIKLELSARAHHRIIKIARTIADLDQKESIEKIHLLEAIQYRPKNI